MKTAIQQLADKLAPMLAKYRQPEVLPRKFSTTRERRRIAGLTARGTTFKTGRFSKYGLSDKELGHAAYVRRWRKIRNQQPASQQ